MPATEEAVLIERLRAREDDAYEEIYREYRHRIYKMAYNLRHDPFFADDVCQETMFRIYNGISSMKGDAALSTWIYRIAYNTALELHRKNKRHIHEMLDTEKIDFADKDQAVGKYDELDRVLSKLKEKERNILVLFYIDDFSIAELARIIGVSEANAKVLLFRARKKAGEVACELQRV